MRYRFDATGRFPGCAGLFLQRHVDAVDGHRDVALRFHDVPHRIAGVFRQATSESTPFHAVFIAVTAA